MHCLNLQHLTVNQVINQQERDRMFRLKIEAVHPSKMLVNFSELQDVTFQKMELFLVTTGKPSNPT
jgi:hypothetical protein